MNNLIKQIICGLLILAISTGAFAVVKVYVLEAKFDIIEKVLDKIDNKIDRIELKINKCNEHL